jgi:hypothetical protein
VPAESRPDRSFAIRDDEQYRPVAAIGDQHVRVRGADGTGLLVCHASRPLDMTHENAGRLVIVVHGALRDSDSYLAWAIAAAAQAGSDALLVAPQFLADVDVSAGSALPDRALYWSAEGWKGGYPALGPAAISSYAAMDALLAELAGPSCPPPAGNPQVVIFGNSAGGQFVNRYAAVGRGPGALAARGIQVRFVIANPSTYLYFGDDRPAAVPDGPAVNRWRYGFEGAPPYVASGPGESLRRYLARDVTIVLGRQDSDHTALLLEINPAAMAQGANRLERGRNYDAHVRRHARTAGLAARHRLIQLAGVGHAARDVLTAEQTRNLMFG